MVKFNTKLIYEDEERKIKASVGSDIVIIVEEDLTCDEEKTMMLPKEAFEEIKSMDT